MECLPFGEADVAPAARLVADSVRTLRERLPVLPSTWQEPAAWEARIAAFTADNPALAAHDGDRLVGFLGAERDDGFSRAYSPEWGHAVVPGGRRILEALYATAARGWVDSGLRTHVIGAIVDQSVEADALWWLGFGAFVVDAIRGLERLPGAAVDVRVRPATIDDLDAVIALEDGLRRHLLTSPVFLVLPAPRTVEQHRARLTDPLVMTLLAEDESGPLAHLRIGSCADDVATIVREAGTASISGAFTLADRRGAGIATTLVNAGLDWARARGYVRCSVDFESANLEAARFWTRWFEPVTTWHVRRLHPRAGTDIV
jgi:GNAT superfamily N-acetyltransferase